MYKRTISLIIASIILTLISLEFLGYILFQKFSLFYYTPELKESTHDLYSLFDPSLGYTFNPDYSVNGKDKEIFFTEWSNNVKRLDSGFIEMSHNPDKSPVKIAILGGSATDSNLFKGNWPYFLHLLLTEKGIPHIIYNGAVSGYSTHQELIKLIRDVFNLDQMDIVISYSGINDTPENEDIVPLHPAIHPYQKYIFDMLVGNINFFKPASILPNTFYMLKKLLKTVFYADKPIQLGVKNSNYIDSFTKNVKYMYKISGVNKARFYHILQPLIDDLSQIDSLFNKEPLDEQSELSKIKGFFAASEAVLRSEPYFVSLRNLFSVEKKVFHDFCHLNEEGNKMVAQRIFTVIFGRHSLKEK